MTLATEQVRLTFEGRFLEQIRRYVSELKALENEPADFKVSFKDHLQAIIVGIEKLATVLEKRAEEMTPDKARKALDVMANTLKAWKEVNATIDQTVGLALKGKLEKRFLLLSPIANTANLNERLHLLRAEQRLTQVLSRTSLEDASSEDTDGVADPDLMALAYATSGARRKITVESPTVAGVPADSPTLSTELTESQSGSEAGAGDTKPSGHFQEGTAPAGGLA